MSDDHTPPNEAKIDRLYAFLSIDDEGRNGIVGSIIPAIGAGGPLVTSSVNVTEYYKGLAQQIADRTGKTIGLFAFVRVEGEELWRSE